MSGSLTTEESQGRVKLNTILHSSVVTKVVNREHTLSDVTELYGGRFQINNPDNSHVQAVYFYLVCGFTWCGWNGLLVA
jgi:hypothetical protein